MAGLRDRLAGCQVVAFADLSTGMVFASSTAEKQTQERLDALCRAGRDAIVGAPAQQLAAAMSDTTVSTPQIAIQGDADRLMCIVCAPHPVQEALCFLFSAEADLEPVPKAATAVLERISAES